MKKKKYHQTARARPKENFLKITGERTGSTMRIEKDVLLWSIQGILGRTTRGKKKKGDMFSTRKGAARRGEIAD